MTPNPKIASYLDIAIKVLFLLKITLDIASTLASL